MFIARCITIKYSNFLKLGTTLFVVICLVISFAFPISAYSGTNATSINVPMSKPEFDKYNKYMEVIARDSLGNYSVYVFVFKLGLSYNTSPDDYYEYVPNLFPHYISSNTIRITVAPDNGGYFSYSCYYFSSDSSSNFFKRREFVLNENGQPQVDVYLPDHSIVAVNYYGFVIDSDAFPPSTNGSYVINYSSDGLIVGYLKKIYDYLPGISTAVNSINTTLLSSNGYLSNISTQSSMISSYVSSIDSNLSSIYSYMYGIDISFATANNYLSSIENSVSYIKDLVSSIDKNTDAISRELFYLSNIDSQLTSIDSYMQYFNYLYGPESLNYFSSIDSTLKDILDGWTTPDDYVPPDVSSPPRNDDTVDEIIDAESEALGGKTDEEIKEEVNDTVDAEENIEKIEGEEIDESDVIIVHNVFDIVLDCCGGKWRTFFVLNLTLAFACFVIGRRF